MEAPKTPECEKLSALHDRYCQIEEFLEFLSEQGIRLAHYDQQFYQGELLTQIPESRKHLLMRFFEIDEQKLEEERNALLEYQRVLTAGVIGGVISRSSGSGV